MGTVFADTSVIVTPATEHQRPHAIPRTVMERHARCNRRELTIEKQRCGRRTPTDGCLPSTETRVGLITYSVHRLPEVEGKVVRVGKIPFCLRLIYYLLLKVYAARQLPVRSCCGEESGPQVWLCAAVKTDGAQGQRRQIRVATYTCICIYVCIE